MNSEDKKEEKVIIYQNQILDPEKIGKFISKLRKDKGMTQEKLGELVFLSRKAISKWETGKSCPTVDTINQLANIFDVTMEEIIAGEFRDKKRRELKGIEKIIRNKFFIIFTSIFMFIIVFCLVDNYYENINQTEFYTIDYEDENFTIRNGTISLIKGEIVINIADIKNINYKNYEYVTHKYEFYIKNKNLYVPLFKYDTNFQINLKEKNYSKYNKIKNNINNLYIKITYNDGKNDIVNTIKLNPKKVKNINNTKPNLKINKSGYNKNIKKAKNINKEKYIDIKPLYDNKKKLRNKTFLFNNKKIILDYNDYTNEIVIKSKERLINLNFYNKTINVYNLNSKYYNAFKYRNNLLLLNNDTKIINEIINEIFM